MAESDLYMQCDEDALEPCQDFADIRVPRVKKASSGKNVKIPVKSDGTSNTTSGAVTSSNQTVPLPSGTTITLVPNGVQAGGATSGPQTFIISTQPNSSNTLGSSVKLGTSVGYFLNGQPISFVPAGQMPQLAASQIVTPASAGNLTTPPSTPITLTLNSPSSPTTSGLTMLSVTPSSLAPTSVPGSAVKLIKVTKHSGAPGNAGSVFCSLTQPNKAIPIQSNHVNRPIAPGPAPALLITGLSQNVKPQVPPIQPTSELKQMGKAPNVCTHCNAFYQRSATLRGYFCQCDQQLLKNIWSLKYQYKRRKVNPSSKYTHPGNPASASPPERSFKNVTSSEVPEGAPSLSSGDYDDQGRLIMLVEDFFYGQCPGRQTIDVTTQDRPISMKCQRCSKKLKGNIKMMNHTKHHMELDLQMGEAHCLTVCSHCYRNFSTPFLLQCHIEAVHTEGGSSKVCKICECAFDNEPLFLEHMKHVHKPGEMPYWCKVCEYRSSFYEDLRAVRHCDKCRLQFCLDQEVMRHKERFHRTCVKPKQLEGLVPGTRIVIRAYADKTDPKDPVEEAPTNTSSNATQTPMIPQSNTSLVLPLKKKPVESMMELLVKLESQFMPKDKFYCMECNYDIPAFSNHFPTYVKCSLCRYCTCCSRAYANHMISVHVARTSTKKYITLYKPCPKKGHLSCMGCHFSTQIGDLMAKHLADFPDHQGCQSTMEGFSRGFKRFVFIPTNLLRGARRQINGGFLPVQLKKVDESLSSFASKPQSSYTITLPEKPARMPSLPKQLQPVEKSADSQKIQEQKLNITKVVSKKVPSDANKNETLKNSLTPAQMKIILHALCCGVPQAANNFGMPAEEVHSLVLKRQSLGELTKTRVVMSPFARDQVIEWVLCQQEQQLPINEAELFARMNRYSGQNISNDTMIDFLLHYDLGLQAFPSTKLLLCKAQELEQLFSMSLKTQIKTQNFRLSSIGAMDELSIFVDLTLLAKPSVDVSSMLSAFKLTGTTDPIIDVMFTALADGTLLSTMLFIKGEPLEIDSGSLPDFIILEFRPEGFTDEERLQIWMERVWLQKIIPVCGGKGLLLMDPYKGHILHEFMVLLNSANTVPCLIPHSCSRRLQPLETCMVRVIREFLQAHWSEHVSKVPQELFKAKPETITTLLVQWLSEILGIIRCEPKILFHSFDRILNSNQETQLEEPSELVQSLAEALFTPKLQEEKPKETRAETSSEVSGDSGLSPQSGMQTLKKIFERDSDVDTFNGFEDSEITDL
ncbi:hypothetical protein DNTS_033223 [Danionella cerebrum]|uniref:C2H2-type domain-containing protein n=1 Tax=Danionella cerebrum TaxID=2873325 RepID=A0A553RE43_9TELE|nr:hypothetical protein DNTS_033223 [Danionella translucida]